MASTTAVTGYLNAGGGDLIHAIVLPDGRAVNYASRTFIEDLDLAIVGWITQRSVTALLSAVGVPTDLAIVPLIGPNGGLTKFAQAFNADGGRNSVMYTNEEFVRKMDPEDADEILKAMAKQYPPAKADKKAA